MAGSNQQIGLNGLEMWAYAVELDDGLRIQLDLDDWQRLNLGVGQRIPVRLPGKADVWLFVTHRLRSGGFPAPRFGCGSDWAGHCESLARDRVHLPGVMLGPSNFTSSPGQRDWSRKALL